MDSNTTNELVKYTKALLLLEVHRLSKNDDAVKPEILLTRAGRSAREIAQRLGRIPEPWRKRSSALEKVEE